MFLNAFMWNLCKCNCWLTIEVILRNARCNSKVYMFIVTFIVSSLFTIGLKDYDQSPVLWVIS